MGYVVLILTFIFSNYKHFEPKSLHHFQKSTESTVTLDIRVGNDSENMVLCESKSFTPIPFEFEEFMCPSPGIIGNVITLTMLSDGTLKGKEVQVYG